MLAFLRLFLSVSADDCCGATNSCDTLQKIANMDTAPIKCVRRPVFADNAKLNDSMAKNEYVIVGRHDCPWCQKASGLLQSKGKAFEFIDLNLYPDLYAKIAGFFAYDYVPIVIHRGAFIGGYTELVNCMADAVQAEVNEKLDMVPKLVEMPPACAMPQLKIVEPLPEAQVQLCPEEKKAIADLRVVAPSNAAQAIQAMEINQKANQVIAVQQQNVTLCQLEEQKKQIAAQVEQQKIATKQVECNAAQQNNAINDQQRNIMDQNNRIVKELEFQAAHQQEMLNKQAACQEEKQKEAIASRIHDLQAQIPMPAKVNCLEAPTKVVDVTQQAISSVPVVSNVVPVVSNPVPVSAVTVPVPVSAVTVPTTGSCLTDQLNPLRNSDTIYVKAPLEVSPAIGGYNSTC